MPALYFFPWLSAQAPLKFEQLTLEPYQRSLRPKEGLSVTLAEIDKLLDFYRTGPNETIDECLLVKFDGQSIGDEINDDQRSFLGSFAQLLCCSYLSDREYFTQYSNYWCADNFQLHAQGWRNPFDGHVVISSRRRDGRSLNLTDAEFDAHYRPHNAAGRSTLQPPSALIQALLSCSATDAWPGLYVGISNFNLANTDRELMTPETEMVLLYGAFQAVFDNVPDQAREHASLLRSYLGTEGFLIADVISDSNIKDKLLSRYRQGTPKSLLEIWFDEFRAMRGHFAHGKARDGYPAIWSADNHLTLGTFLFPLLLKRRLAAMDHYEWSQQDQADLACFENLLQYNHFANQWFENVRDRHKHPWHRIRKQTVDAIRSKRLYDELLKHSDAIDRASD